MIKIIRFKGEDKMSLVNKAKKEAKKNGKRLNPDVVKGLKAVQVMHNLCKKSKGSPYKNFISRKGK